MADDSAPGPPILKPVFGILAAIGWLLLMGLHVIWRVTFGWLFTTLAGLIDVGIPIPHFHDPHPFGHVADWLRSLDRNVDNALVTAANQLEHVAVWLFSRLGWLISRVPHELVALALAVEQKFIRLIRVTVPHLIRDLLRFVWRELRALGRYARKMIPKLARQLFRFSRWAAHEISKGARHLGFVFKWAKAAFLLHWRAIMGIWRRLKSIEHALVPKRFRGMVAKALKLLGLEWLFGANIIALGAWLLALDIGPVREWVKDAISFAGNTDICKVASYQFDVALFIFDPVMQELIGLSEWVCHHSGHTLPSATGGTAGYIAAWEPSATPRIADLKDTRRLAPNVPLPRGVISA